MVGIDRVKTGVSGLDALIGGGIPAESVVLVSGAAGTGKTVLALQFLAKGAATGERAVYFTFEEREDKIRDQCNQFGWPIEKLEKQKKLLIKNISKDSIGGVLGEIKATINSFKPSRMVVDSMTTLSLYAHTLSKVTNVEGVEAEEAIYGAPAPAVFPPEWDGLVVRRVLVTLVKMLQSHRITTIMTSELSENSNWYSRDTLSEFACDGVIILKATSLGEENHRTLEVKKMRNTPIKGGVYSFEFGRNGVLIPSSNLEAL
ncbi:MAG: ATPase domain-containing protein [Candidatus Micrarchaeota archaeon]